MNLRLTLFSAVLAISMNTGAALAQQTPVSPATKTELGTEVYYRTELYLGRSIPGGGSVSDEAWEKFLAEVVTPLFPNGFTILAGRGQYRETSGVIVREPSHVLVFLYRKRDRRTAGAGIEKIREEYKNRFAQESVLRVDITRSVRVSF